MKDFFKGKTFKAIVCVLALLVGIIIYQAATGNYASFPEAVVGTVVSPVASASAKVSDSVAGFFNMLVTAKDTKKENDKLKTELAEAQKRLSELEKYKNENDQLKEYLGIKTTRPDYEMETASVIGRSVEYSFSSFTVNRGSLNGIEVSDPVITSQGLVGIVSHVGPTYSTVRTVVDTKINIGAYNSRTQSTGVVSGTLELAVDGKTKLRLLPRDTALQKGDIVETSGIGGVFPAGVLVGTVDSIRPESSGASMYAEITPAVDVRKVTDVIIITEFTGQGEEYKPEDSAVSE